MAAQPPTRPELVATIGKPCPYCGEAMLGPDRWPTRDHIKPRSKGYRLTADNRAIICQPCNKAKGSLSLQRFANQLARVGDPRATRVEGFILRLAQAHRPPSTGSASRAVFLPVESN